MHYTPYDIQNYEIHSITVKPLNDDDGSSRKPNYKDISRRWPSGLERSPRRRKVWSSNPSRERPKS